MKTIFAVYKPTGITSHDVVGIVRRKTGVKRVGHGGTLDPLAEGVLVIAVGRENTKLLDKYVKGDKEYVATLKLGFTSETDDSEGPIVPYPRPQRQQAGLHGGRANIPNPPHISTLPEIKTCLKTFIGKIQQTPPIYSAIKINGREAYKYARAGRNQARNQGVTLSQGRTLNEGPTLKARTVEIMEIEIIRYEYPLLEIKVECGTGVYIRSLARDIGTELGVGAYLTKLVRTKVGEFRLEDALKIEGLEIGLKLEI